MPVNRKADYFLNGKPYMLARGDSRGRAWQRTGVPDSPDRRGPSDLEWGNLPAVLDRPEVWDDWSGGYGNAYRDPEAPNIVHWSENMDTRFPRQMVHCQRLLTIGTNQVMLDAGMLPYVRNGAEFMADIRTDVVGSVEAGAGQVLVVGGNGHMVIQPTGVASSDGAFVVDHPALAGGGGPQNRANIGYRPALFGNYILAGDLGGTYHYQAHRSMGVLEPVGSLPTFGFAVAGNRLWRWHGPSVDRGIYMQSCADSTYTGLYTAANWSATLPVGPGYYGIRDVVALNDQLFAGLPDGVYAGDYTGTFVNVLPQLASQIHYDNCRDLTVYEGRVVTQHVTGLYEYYPSDENAIARQISFPQPANSPIHGYPRCVRGHGPWLYAGLYSGSYSYLMAGRETPAGYQWHILNRLPNVAKIHRLHFDGITIASGNKRIPTRMWIATDGTYDTGGTSALYWAPIPAVNDNPLVSDPAFSANYVGSARVDLGRVDWNAPGTPKAFRAVEVWADNLASGAQWCDVYYQIDGKTRTKLGTTARSPKDTLYFLSSEGSFATGQSIELSLESFTASPNITPIYRAVILRGVQRPKTVGQITAVTRIADEMRDRQNTPMRPGALMLAELRALGQQASPVQLVDLAGATSWVNVLGDPEEAEVYQKGEDDPEIAATVRLAVLEYSG